MQKILVVEDEIAIQSVLKELLTDTGYSVTVADKGLAGITAFRNDKYESCPFSFGSRVSLFYVVLLFIVL